MSQLITVQVEGRRVYVRTPYGHPAVAELKRLGAHSEYRDGKFYGWWLGTAKRAEVEALVADANRAEGATPTPASARVAPQLGLSPETPAGVVADALSDQGRDREAAAVTRPTEDVSKSRVLAAVTHKGRRYYVIAEQRSQATATEPARPLRCRLVTLDADAVPFWVDCAACELIRTYEPREYRGRTEYTTVGSLRRFRERQADPATRRGECTECGHFGPSGQPCSECGGEGTHV